MAVKRCLPTLVGAGRFPDRSGRAGARGGGDATEPTSAARVPAVWDRHRHPYRHQRRLADALAARGRLRVISVACGTGRMAACRAAWTERRTSRSPLQLRYSSRHGPYPEGAELRLTGRAVHSPRSGRDSHLVTCVEWRVPSGRSGRAAWRLRMRARPPSGDRRPRAAGGRPLAGLEFVEKLLTNISRTSLSRLGDA
jgi:hypothetical protein